MAILHLCDLIMIRLTVVVYDPEEKQFCKLKNAAIRSEKIARLLLPANFSCHAVHCYISFYAADREKASTNEYLGMVEVF